MIASSIKPPQHGPATKVLTSPIPRHDRAESREPRAESREPRAESREPRAESREPRAESREPRAESREPRAESREPRAESREPRAESREPRAESREPTGCVMARLSTRGRATLACLALLTAAALLALAAPAEAQTEIWSATLTPQPHANATLGCKDDVSNSAHRCSNTSVLTESDFTFDSTDYTVGQINLIGGAAFQFGVAPAFSAAFDTAILEVDGTSFPFADAIVTTGEGTLKIWSVSLSWTAGTDVSLRLIANTAPGVPTGVTATASGQSRIDLAWTAPVDTGGSDITGYRIEVSPDGAAWSDLAADTGSTATAYAHMGLDPATTRHYRVSAINAVGTSDASDSDDATTEAATVTTPQTTVTQTAGGATWSLQGPTSLTPGSTYTYTITRTAGTEPLNEYVGFYVPSTSTSVAHSNLGSNPTSCGTGKYFCASFSPSSLPGIWNNIQSHHTIHSVINNNTTVTATLAVTANTPTGTTITFGAIRSNAAPRSGGLVLTVGGTTTNTAPDAPTGLTATANGKFQIDLSWTAPVDDGGSAITGYKIEHSVNGTSWFDSAADTGSTATAYSEDMNLDPGTTYHFRVSAINAVGTSDPSTSDDATTVDDTDPTVANLIPDQTATAGTAFDYTFPDTTFTDADGDTLGYTATQADDTALPSWLTFDGASRTFSGTPATTDVGTVSVKVTATDPDRGVVSDTFDIVVSAAVMSSCPLPSFGDRRVVWTGEMTVAAIMRNGAVVGHGFGGSGPVGGLTPTQIDTGRNTYTVDVILVSSTGTSDGNLIFSLTGAAATGGKLSNAEKTAMRLHVCNDELAFSTASYMGASGTYTWAEDFDWSLVSPDKIYLSLPGNKPATGAPAIAGPATVGERLAADATGIADADGLAGVDFTYKWFRVDADGVSNEAEISGATSATYTLTDDDVGKKVKVQVSFTDDLGGEEMRTSAATVRGRPAVADTTPPQVP